MTRIMIAVLALVLGWTCVAQASDMEEARNRRRARRAQIEQIIRNGDAVEGDDGFLTPKTGLSEEKTALVRAENADRRIGYEAIAKANNKTVEEVGRQAAAINRRAAK